MKMLEIAALPNGAHKNQTYHGNLPEGWAVVPADMTLDNFPFGEVEVAEVDGAMTVTKWTAGVMPEPAALTPTQQREEAYNTLAIVAWDDEMLTVTQAAQLWQYYAAEGSVVADELRAAIAEAKAGIRAIYPDEATSSVTADAGTPSPQGEGSECEEDAE